MTFSGGGSGLLRWDSDLFTGGGGSPALPGVLRPPPPEPPPRFVFILGAYWVHFGCLSVITAYCVYQAVIGGSCEVPGGLARQEKLSP